MVWTDIYPEKNMYKNYYLMMNKVHHYLDHSIELSYN